MLTAQIFNSDPIVLPLTLLVLSYTNTHTHTHTVSAAGTEVWFSLCCRHKGLVRKAFGRMPARAHVMKVMWQAEVDGGQRVREDEAASQVERQQPPQQDPEKGLRYDTYILS